MWLPEANPGRIRFALEGAQGLRIDSQGDLLVKVEGGELRFRQPGCLSRGQAAANVRFRSVTS